MTDLNFMMSDAGFLAWTPNAGFRIIPESITWHEIPDTWHEIPSQCTPDRCESYQTWWGEIIDIPKTPHVAPNII